MTPSNFTHTPVRKGFNSYRTLPSFDNTLAHIIWAPTKILITIMIIPTEEDGVMRIPVLSECSLDLGFRIYRLNKFENLNLHQHPHSIGRVVWIPVLSESSYFLQSAQFW